MSTVDFFLPCACVPNDAILGRADGEFIFEAWENPGDDVASFDNDSGNVVPIDVDLDLLANVLLEDFKPR